MPVTLPSGLTLWLTAEHILEPDRNWFKAPDNHFWYLTPEDDTPPPYAPDEEYYRRLTSAPVPRSRAEMERYIAVIIDTPDGRSYWRGEMLSEFPRYGTLSAEDNEAWREWLAGDLVKDYLDRVIAYCQVQAEVNREARGYAVFHDVQENGDGDFIGKHYADNPLKNAH